MKAPDTRTLRLVADVARAFEDYHGEHRGNLACLLQAAGVLIKAGPLWDYEPTDFLRFEEYRRPPYSRTQGIGL